METGGNHGIKFEISGRVFDSTPGAITSGSWASPDNSDTHGSNAGRSPASTRPQTCVSAWPAADGATADAGYNNGGTGGGLRVR